MSARLPGKQVILGVGGGIAGYKACDLASRLVKEGARVTAVLTRNARKFVTPYSFEALTGQPCLTKSFKRIASGDNPYPHIEPAKSAELVIIAPATAGLIAKFAHGFADELLPTLMLSIRCPVLICPAMNVQMWNHPAVQANADILRKFGHTLIGPDAGTLACGMEGAGRLTEPAEIIEAACKALNAK